MSAFTITLDTTAPVVTWGPVTDPNAGEEMSVEYLVNEPGIDHAEIELMDGRVIPMVDTGTTLTVLLPDDAPEGTAVVRAYTEDEVDNAAVRALAVHITGVLAPTPTPGMPPLPTPGVVRVRVVSVAHGSSSYTATAELTSDSTVRGSSRYTGPGRRRLQFADRVAASATWRTSASTRTVSTATTGSTTSVQKRPEGPGHEDELLLLDLL